MKKFSKLFWVALVVVAVLACTAIGIFAAETNSTAVVFAEATEVAENANFDAVIKYKDNSSKVECGKITLTWDSELMSVTSIAKADALNGAQFGYNSTTPGTAVIAWAGSNIDAGTEGNLFTVTFKNESIANDGYAAIEVVVDDFGYTNGFDAVEATVAPSKAYATGSNATDLDYDDTVTDSAEEFLSDVIALAESLGTTINVTLKKNMEFTKDAVIGTAGATHDGNVVIKSTTTTTTTTTGEGEEAVTKTTTLPDYGITIYCDVILNMYGNFEFDDINFNNTLKSLDEKVSQSWSTGGVMNFVEGLGKFGHPDPDTSDDVNDFGLIEVSRRAHLSGHVEVYTGSYWTISGNFYNTGVDVKDPSVKVLGNVSVNYVFGQLHNGGTKTSVSGTSTLEVSGRNYISAYLVGGSYNTTTTPIPSNITINNRTSQISKFVVGSYYSSTSTVKYNKNNKFNVVIDYMLVPTTNSVNLFTLHSGNRGTTTGLNVDLTINDGSYRSIISFGMDGTHNADSMRLTDSIVKVTINGGEFQKSVYCGSVLTGKDGINKTIWEDGIDRTVTINGGEFKSTFYGGSYITCGDKSYHGSALELNIHGGTFKNDIMGGSNLLNATAYHGKVLTDGTRTEDTIIVKPGKDKAFTQTGGHFIGGSRIAVDGAEHKGNTKVYLKDINNRGTGTQTGSLQSYFCKGNVIAAGSQISGDGTHSGNSKLIIQRCNLNENCIYVAGSRLDGNNSEHSGTSELIIDGNTGLKKVDGVFTDEEIVGTNGWNNLYENGSDGWFGGSYINGWYQYTEPNPDYDPNVEGSQETITVTGATSNAKQTGESSAKIIGPSDYVDGNSGHMVQIRGGYGAGVYGGHYYAHERITLPQQNDSYVEITGTVRTGTGNVSTSPTYVYAFGGSYYNANSFTYTEDSFIASSKVIIDGTWTGNVVGGVNTKYNSTGAVYKHNVGVTLKTGNAGSNIYPCSWVNTGTYKNFSGSTQGYGLIEIYDTYGLEDNDLLSISILNKFTSGTRAIKLIGDFNDTDNDNFFKLNVNVDYAYLDLAQANGSNITVQKRTAQKDSDGNTVKDENGNTVYTYTATCKSGSVERIFNKKNIYFAQADSTLASNSSTLAASKQVEVNPTMTFAELLATAGLKIYNTYDPAQTTVVWNSLQDYSRYTMFDCVSTSPNAFEFYAVGEDGKAIGEALTQIPADPSQKIIVKAGTTYSAPTYLRHAFRLTSATLELSDGIAILFKVNKTVTSLGYENISAKVTLANKETIIATPNETIDANRYTFVFDELTPAQMLDIAEIQFFAKHNGEECTSQVGEYSVRTYCDKQLPKLDLSNEAYRKLGSLMVDMLNYGAATQLYVNSLLTTPLPENEIELANKDLAAEYVALATTDELISPVIESFTGLGTSTFKLNTGDVTLATPRTAALALQDSIGIQFVIGVEPTTDISGLKAIITRNSSPDSSEPENGEIDTYEVPASEFFIYDENGNIYDGTAEIPLDKYGQYRYRIPFNELNPAQMDDFFYVYIVDADGNIVSNTMRYGIGVYASSKNDNAATPLGVLVKEMMKYGYSADSLNQ